MGATSCQNVSWLVVVDGELEPPHAAAPRGASRNRIRDGLVIMRGLREGGAIDYMSKRTPNARVPVTAGGKMFPGDPDHAPSSLPPSRAPVTRSRSPRRDHR